MTCFLAGLALGSLITFAACALWAFRAMHPHDAPERPTSADQGSGKGQVPLERYAQKARE